MLFIITFPQLVQASAILLFPCSCLVSSTLYSAFLYFVFNPEDPVYLSSQSYMADSSLSEEMSQFDFSTGVQSFSYSSQSAVGQKRTSRKRVSKAEVLNNVSFLFSVTLIM